MTDAASPDNYTRASPAPPPAAVQVRWSWISLGLLVLTVSAVGALIVVASIRKSDVLSTTALALAVLAFALQLIVSLAQGISGAQQLAHVERVNSDTQAALASLRATTDSLLATQREHFTALLKAAVTGKSWQEDESGSNGNEADPEVKPAEPVISSWFGPVVAERPEPAVEAKIMTAYPSEERGRELASIFNSLTPWEATAFSSRSRLALLRAKKGREIGGFVVPDMRGPSASTRGLEEKGLIDNSMRIREEGKVQKWSTLTPLGVELASLLHGDGPLPDWLRQEMTPKSVA